MNYKSAYLRPGIVLILLACLAVPAAIRAQTCANCRGLSTSLGTDALANFGDDTRSDTAIGYGAMQRTTIGRENTAVGAEALNSNQNADGNTAVGFKALARNSGASNTATGWEALISNSSGNFNVADGAGALSGNTSGEQNTATGVDALSKNSTGGGNTAVGISALKAVINGNENIALGSAAGRELRDGNNNIYIGNFGVASENNTIRIGTVKGSFAHTRSFIAGINGVTVTGGLPVYVKSDGQLGTLTSSARFKDEIKPMDEASEAILGLRPVTFRYKSDSKGPPQFGLIAEEVAKVNPALVLPDKEGKPFAVRYEAVNAMLLNEFLKEHRKVQEQEAAIAQLKTDFSEKIEQLTASLNEQASQIQKVRAQLEVSNPGPQTVCNDHQK